MTNTIYVTTKADLIKSVLNIKKGLDRITTYNIEMNDVGLKENPELLYKILTYADGLCRINYCYKNFHYIFTKEDNIEDVTSTDLQLSTLQDKQNNSNSNTLSEEYKPKFYDWQSFAVTYTDNKYTVYQMIKELSYYISPVIDQTRFINMLKNRITVLNSIKDFTPTVTQITGEDVQLGTYDFIYVLKPQQRDAIDMLSEILNSKLQSEIGYYIFIFKCGKQWFTLSKHKEISLGYFTGNILNINGVYYDFEKIKEVLDNVHSN